MKAHGYYPTKVCGMDRRLPIPLTQTTKATGGEAESNPSWYSRGTWKTSNLPDRESHSQEVPTGLLVQDDGKSEGHAVIAWIEGEIFSYAKASRLPSGLSVRENSTCEMACNKSTLQAADFAVPAW